MCGESEQRRGGAGADACRRQWDCSAGSCAHGDRGGGAGIGVKTGVGPGEERWGAGGGIADTWADDAKFDIFGGPLSTLAPQAPQAPQTPHPRPLAPTASPAWTGPTGSC